MFVMKLQMDSRCDSSSYIQFSVIGYDVT